MTWIEDVVQATRDLIDDDSTRRLHEAWWTARGTGLSWQEIADQTSAALSGLDVPFGVSRDSVRRAVENFNRG